ncbi:MAG: hypothetical protein HOM25_03650 [Rhodospirillaceae bacterium]|jgi:hypothetical protein|nr:hypothetical protein [Rhodospirillaceae bacterium]
MLRKLSLAWMAALFGLSLAYTADTAKADGAIVNVDPLAWELACPPAACTENLGQTTYIEFRFTDLSDVVDPGDTFLNMKVLIINTGIAGQDGDLATLAMEMPTDYISSVAFTSVNPGPQSEWAAGYSPEAVSLTPFGAFDMCLQSKKSQQTLSDDAKLKCESGNEVGVAAGESATFNFLIGVSSPGGVSDLSYIDANGDEFFAEDAFRGLFAEAVATADNAQGSGVCGHFQRITDTNDGSDKVCGTPVDAIPEPSALPLWLIGMMGVVGAAAKRRNVVSK